MGSKHRAWFWRRTFCLHNNGFRYHIMSLHNILSLDTIYLTFLILKVEIIVFTLHLNTVWNITPLIHHHKPSYCLVDPILSHLPPLMNYLLIRWNKNRLHVSSHLPNIVDTLSRTFIFNSSLQFRNSLFYTSKVRNSLHALIFVPSDNYVLHKWW